DDVGRLEVAGQLRIVPAADERGLHACGARGRVERRSRRTIADHDQARVRMPRSHARHRVDEMLETLARLEPADEDDVPTPPHCARPPPRPPPTPPPHPP